MHEHILLLLDHIFSIVHAVSDASLVLVILWHTLARKALKWKFKFRDTVLNIGLWWRQAKDISISLQNPTRDLLRQRE